MEGLAIPALEDKSETGDKFKSKKAAEIPPRNAQRRKLADISNLTLQPQALSKGQKLPTETNIAPSKTNKEFINQLQQENMKLVKMLADKNKIIEVTSIELQKLRINLQKMQQQNLQLAQSNSQMLMELTSDKNKLKELRHELGCINCLLKTKEVEMEEKLKKNCMKPEVEVMETNSVIAEKSSLVLKDNAKPGCGQPPLQDKNETKRPLTRRQSAVFQSEGLKPLKDSIEVDEPKCVVPSDDSVQENGQPPLQDRNETKRPCTRRQSALFQFEGLKPLKDPVEVDDPKCVVPSDDSVQENGSTTKCTSSKNVVPSDDSVQENGSTTECTSSKNANKYEAQKFGRSSLSRPLRQAAQKVQSYKEIPVNVKMRRPE